MNEFEENFFPKVFLSYSRFVYYRLPVIRYWNPRIKTRRISQFSNSYSKFYSNENQTQIFLEMINKKNPPQEDEKSILESDSDKIEQEKDDEMIIETLSIDGYEEFELFEQILELDKNWPNLNGKQIQEKFGQPKFLSDQIFNKMESTIPNSKTTESGIATIFF